mgnify:CR=1 FL=1
MYLDYYSLEWRLARVEYSADQQEMALLFRMDPSRAC